MDPPDLLIRVAFAACVPLILVCGLAGLSLACVTALLMLGDFARPNG